MTDKAAISGTYSDFKIIRTRKIAQLIIEIPIEQAQAAITALGLPNPASETWVAVARLQSPQEAAPAPIKQHRPFEELPLPQQAALACQDMEFRDFIRQYYENDLKNEEDATFFVREWCDVKSRAEIKRETPAGDKWGRLYNRFLLWKSARAA